MIVKFSIFLFPHLICDILVPSYFIIMLSEDVDHKNTILSTVSRFEVLARSGYLMLWNTKNCRMHAQEGHSWCAVKKKKKNYTFLFKIDLWYFPISLSKLGRLFWPCASLPFPAQQISYQKRFDSQLKQVWVTEQGDLVKAFSLLTQCGRRYQSAQEITLYRFLVLTLIFPIANISCCFACGVHILSLNIFELSVYQHPCPTISCCVHYG